MNGDFLDALFASFTAICRPNPRELPVIQAV
jgi:hypothetical protein